MFVINCVSGGADLDVNDSGTLVWDPKVVENLTDEECKYTPLCEQRILNENNAVIFSSLINQAYKPNN